MAESSNQDIILMAVLAVTRDDVLASANELGMSAGQLTDDVIELVKERMRRGLGDWPEVVKGMVKEAIKRETVACPLGMVCSPSCAWREVGGCILPEEAK